MPTPKMIETSAARYRRIRAEKAKGEELHDVECKCGMIWKARRLTVEFWVSSGILPMHLVETMLQSQGTTSDDPNEVLRKMAAPEIIQSIVFASKVVRYTAVEPAIVAEPKEPNDISQEEVLTCCYTRLLYWQMKGGVEAESLGTFPKE